MPQIFKVGGYLIYFWSNEEKPLEPVHFHITDGYPTENATKVWITKSGHCLLCHNKSNIPKHKLNKIMDVVQARHKEVIDEWYKYFGEISYYC